MAPDVAATPPQRLEDGRLVDLGIVAEHGDGIARAQADLVGDLVGPAHDEPVHVREALAGHERRASVDDDDLVAELARQAGQRLGDGHAADDDEPRADGEDLDEELPTSDLERRGEPLADGRTSGLGDVGRVRSLRSQAALGRGRPPWTTSGLGHRRARTARPRRRSLARRAVPAAASRRHGSTATLAAGRPATAVGTAGWTSTSIVPPQARPTSQACSSLTPKRTTRCSPDARACLEVRARWRPRRSRRSPTRRCARPTPAAASEPSRRGAEP